MHARWQHLTSIDAGPGGGITTVGEAALVAHRGLIRDPGAGAARVTSGPTVCELALDHCRNQDLSSLRQLLMSYRDLVLAAGPDAPGVDRAALLDVDNVALEGADLQIIDPSFTFLIEDREAALVMHLRGLAEQVLTRRAPNPWPAGSSVDDLADTFCAMVGLRHALHRDAAILLQTQVQAAFLDLDEESEATLYARLVDPQSVVGRWWLTGLGHREAIAANRQLEEELLEARAQIEWLEERVRLREGQLRKVEEDLAGVVGSVSFKVGRKVTAPMRRSRRALTPPND